MVYFWYVFIDVVGERGGEVRYFANARGDGGFEF